MTTKTRKLTEKQQKFLDVLYDEAGGDISAAIKLAGYGETIRPYFIINSLHAEIQSATEKFLASNSAKAAVTVVKVLDGDADALLGADTRLKAAKEVMDRVISRAPQKVDLGNENGGGNLIMVLPVKATTTEVPQFDNSGDTDNS